MDDEAKLKKVHGDDVELGQDTSEDDHLEEAEALEQAKAEGIEFVDEWRISGRPQDEIYATESEAQVELKEGEHVIQTRRKKQEGDE